MATTAEQLLNRLVESGIWSESDLASARPSVSADGDGERAARELIKLGRLTKFQAQQLLATRPGVLVLGNYVLLDKIGAGGMGQVFKAEHRRMKRTVALKVLPQNVTRDTGAVNRFHREVQAAARLTHPNIVAAHDADEAKGIHYLVMEYVEGEDLASLIRRKGAQPLATVVDLMIQAARGLEYAHSQGVVHRDIKPSNLLLDRRGTVKILDMGLARIDGPGGESGGTLTSTGMVMGTIDYMSPEQALDTKHAGPQSDIYSLGCTLFYLATGRAPFDGDTVMKKLLAHREAPVPSLGESMPATGESTGERLESLGRIAAVDDVLRRMLAKHPRDRFATMSDVIRALEGAGVAQAASAPRRAAASESSASIAVADERGNADFALERPKPARKPAAEVDTTPSSAFEGTLANLAADLKRPQPSARSTGSTRPPSGTIKGRQPSPAPSSGWLKPPRLYFVAGAVVAVGALLAGLILRVETPQGTIVLKIDQPELAGAEVSVDGQQKITIKAQGDSEPIVLAADEKEHTLRVTKGGFATLTRSFTVKSGEATPIEVWLEPDDETASSTATDSLGAPELVNGLRAAGARLFAISNGALESEVTNTDQLPKGPFKLRISLMNAKVKSNDLKLLEHLSTLGPVQSVTLELTGSDVTDAELPHVARMDALRWLVLHNCSSVTDAGIRNLEPVLSTMESLDLGGSSPGNPPRITGETIRLLAVRADSLQNLGLQAAELTDDDLRPLIGRSRLQSLAISQTYATPAMVDSLKAGTTGLQVSADRLRPAPQRTGGQALVDWIPLFDGQNTSRWEKLGTFKVGGGLLTASEKTLAVSKQEFDDFELEFEWKITAGGNSGVYYRNPTRILTAPAGGSGLEYAIADPAEARPQVATGAAYGAVPVTRMAERPIGEFNVGRIVCRGPQVEHWLNGQLVASFDESKPGFVASFPNPGIRKAWESGHGPGPICLQGNVGTVSFRSVRVRELKPAQATAESKGGWTDLSEAASWRTPGPFRFNNGQVQASQAGVAETRAEYGDFELEFAWQIAPGGNGGLFYRNPLGAVATTETRGCEYQLLDNARHPNGRKPETTAASLFGVLAPTEDATRPVGEFNQSRIVCRGSVVEHWLNGRKVVSYDSGDPATQTAVSRFRNLPASATIPIRGTIVLQAHTGAITFRDIRIRELTTAPAAAGVAPAAGGRAVTTRVQRLQQTNPSLTPLDPDAEGRFELRPADGNSVANALCTDVVAKDVVLRANIARPPNSETAASFGIRAAEGAGLYGADFSSELVSIFRWSPQGERTNLLQQPLPAALADGTYDFEFSALGSRLEVRMNGQSVGACEDSNLSTPGLVTFVAHRFPLRMRNVEIEIRDAEGYTGRSSLAFDGADDAVEIPALKFDPAAPFTVEAWINPTAAKPIPDNDREQNYDPIFCTNGPYDPAAPSLALILDRPHPGWWAGRHLQGASTNDTIYLRDAASLQGPYHVALVHDGRRLLLFRNGQRLTTTSRSPPIPADSNTADTPPLVPTLGSTFYRSISRSRFFCGSFSEFRISTVARYAEDFDPEPQFATSPGTQVLYHFNEGRGEVLNDSSGYGHNGKIAGASWVTAPAP